MARAGRTLALSLGALWLLCLAQAAGASPRDAYILSRGDNSFSTNCSVDAMLAVKETLSGSFLWVRRAGKVYVIRDERVLGEAQELFAPLRSLDPEHEALAVRQKRLEAEEEDLDREQDKIEQELDRLADDEDSKDARRDRGPIRRDLERRKRDLEPRQRAVHVQERELERIERSIDEREDALEKRIEAKLWRLIDESIGRGVGRPDEAR